MRLPYSWLRDVVQAGAPGWDVSVDELEQTLIRIGHEVEDVIPVGPVSGPLIVGRVLEIEELTEFKKPIRAVKVDVGEAEPRDIVCGATNFAIGDLVVVALPGTTLPGDFTITARKTYGRTSDGMICSTAELNLGTDHSGILVLPPGTAEPGAPAADVLGLDDTVFDLAITPDRGYCLSVRGMAREIANAYDLDYVDPADVAPLPADGEALPVTIEPGTGVLRFGLRPVTGIDPTAVSPWWLQRRLLLSGIRAISPAVDVTNYVMLELGHPMHAHDRSLITGGFRVRFAEPGETVVTLDDIERKLDPADVLIVDDVATAAIGGVMGAGTTEVRDNTTDVLLEAAVWDPAAVSRTLRRLHLPSEAARRYERFVDPADLGRRAGPLCDIARRDRRRHSRTDVDRLARRSTARGLVAAAGEHGHRSARPHGGRGLPGGHHASQAHADRRRCRRRRRPGDRDTAELAARPARARRSRRGGAAAGGPRDHPVGAAAGARRARPHAGAEAPPCHRKVVGAQRICRDPADTVPAARGVRPVGPAARRSASHHHARAQSAGVRPPAAGHHVAARAAGSAWPATCPAGPSTWPCSRSSRWSSRRRKPVPSNGFRPTAGRPTTRSRRSTRRCRTSRSTSAWCWPACASPRARGDRVVRFDASDAFEAVRIVGRAAGVELTLRPAQYLPWHPGRCAEVLVGDTVVGHAGQLHPAVVERSALPKGTCAVELNLDAIPLTERLPAPAVSPFPAVFQDVALIVDDEVAAQSVVDAVRDGAGELLEDVRLFDVYTGPQIGEGRKSLALALRFRAADRTLTEDEASAARDAAVANAAQRVGAEQRR